MTTQPTLINKSGIMFVADLVGYTAYGKEHGNEATVLLLDRFYRMVERAAAGKGDIMKFIGDAVLIRFPEDAPDDVLEVALEIQAKAELPLGAGIDLGAYVESAIGIDGGPEIHGDVVNGAFIVRGQHGIFATERFVTKLGDDKRAEWKSNSETSYIWNLAK